MQPVMTIIDTFEIPDDLAKELSSLLTKQMIRERTLATLVGKPEYDEFEEALVKIVDKAEALKLRITREFVPAKYNSAKYTWSYNGYEVSKNVVDIATMK